MTIKLNMKRRPYHAVLTQDWRGEDAGGIPGPDFFQQLVAQEKAITPPDAVYREQWFALLDQMLDLFVSGPVLGPDVSIGPRPDAGDGPDIISG